MKYNPNKNSTGYKIFMLRMQHNLSQEDLAKDLGICRSSLSNYENNKAEPKTTLLKKIATYFKVKTNKLL